MQQLKNLYNCIYFAEYEIRVKGIFYEDTTGTYINLIRQSSEETRFEVSGVYDTINKSLIENDFRICLCDSVSQFTDLRETRDINCRCANCMKLKSVFCFDYKIWLHNDVDFNNQHLDDIVVDAMKEAIRKRSLIRNEFSLIDIKKQI